MTLLTVKELSEFIKIKEKTIYQWVELGQIPAMKLNGSVRFDPRRIDNWMQACAIEPISSYNPLTQTRSPKKGGME